MNTPDQRDGHVDWAGIHARIEQSVASAAEALHPSPARACAIMEERARLLARVPEVATAAGQTLELVCIALADERYAVGLSFAQEVVRFREPTIVPGMPAHLVGLVNFRGELLPVVDLRPLLGLPTPSATDQTRVIVLGSQRAELGLLADRAFAVGRVRASELFEPSGREHRGIRGVTADGLVVLDGATLLADDRFFFGRDGEGGAG
ncbi:MAG: chemotaxis protein CheW [Gemmataceae bacterium]|nr:chemotaxis protein CheW [Gemmataceae bacterium]